MASTSGFNHAKVEGLIRRAGLRYPGADLRRLDLVDERGLDRNLIAQLGTCSFIERQQNVVFQGFTGSGKSYLGALWPPTRPASTSTNPCWNSAGP
ncbi:UNVERIFIED_ORG: DNA replication protein DnaC [Arthrobacter globiformis]|nr:DNA replication protein DnaC [Arthrobacter globiformis]